MLRDLGRDLGGVEYSDRSGRLPTAAEIVDTLNALSQYQGMKDKERVRTHGAPLRPLPCVEGAQVALRLEEIDWPLAVEEALECVIKRGDNFPGLTGKFLRRLLALDGSLGSMSSRLDDFLVEEPGWVGNADNTVEKQRQLLIATLAHKIRTAQNYPCVTGDARTEEFADILLKWTESQSLLRWYMKEQSDLSLALSDMIHEYVEALCRAWGITEPPRGNIGKVDALLQQVVRPIYEALRDEGLYESEDGTPILEWRLIYRAILPVETSEGLSPGKFEAFESADLEARGYTQLLDRKPVREIRLVASILLSPKDSPPPKLNELQWMPSPAFEDSSHDAFWQQLTVEDFEKRED